MIDEYKVERAWREIKKDIGEDAAHFVNELISKYRAIFNIDVGTSKVETLIIDYQLGVIDRYDDLTPIDSLVEVIRDDFIRKLGLKTLSDYILDVYGIILSNIEQLEVEVGDGTVEIISRNYPGLAGLTLKGRQFASMSRATLEYILESEPAELVCWIDVLKSLDAKGIEAQKNSAVQVYDWMVWETML